MRLKSIHVKNFRSIKDEILHCDNLTALVGANGSGKSSFLHALELFYSKSPRVEIDDYYNSDTSKDIIVTITFSNLSKSATQLFASYIQNDELVVERVFKWDESKAIHSYHGSLLQNPDFIEVYNSNATDAKQKYNELKEKTDYQSFPAWSNHTKAKEFLKSWENANPTKCKRMRDDGQFFGFTEVAKGYLGRFIRFLYIPAVREAASDASESRSSVLTELMDIAIRNKLFEKKEIKEFQADTKERYSQIMDPTNLPEIKDLATKMTKTLQNFVPNAEISLSWGSISEFEVKLPEAVAKLVEDGYQSTVNRTGHGLQRAFIMTILQHLSLVQISTSETNPEEADKPVLVLIIEEPELYQHPNRQRHLAKVFLKLSESGIGGVSTSMQIIYSTHSPQFVGIDRINQIRLLRKVAVISSEPKITKIYSTNMDSVAKQLEKLYSDGTQYSGDSLKPRLHAIMTPWMNEGFFSDVVVLVEGEVDRAVVLGVAEAMGHDLESLGISIIPCFSKANLDRPAIIFRNLGIPVFLIWDSDKGNGTTTENHRLLALMNHKKEDWPNKVEKEFACFEKNMDTLLKNEIGDDLFEKCMGECEKDFAMPQKQARKNPVVISKIIKKSGGSGKSSQTIEKIVKNVLALKKI